MSRIRIVICYNRTIAGNYSNIDVTYYCVLWTSRSVSWSGERTATEYSIYIELLVVQCVAAAGVGSISFALFPCVKEPEIITCFLYSFRVSG